MWLCHRVVFLCVHISCIFSTIVLGLLADVGVSIYVKLEATSELFEDQGKGLESFNHLVFQSQANLTLVWRDKVLTEVNVPVMAKSTFHQAHLFDSSLFGRQFQPCQGHDWADAKCSTAYGFFMGYLSSAPIETLTSWEPDRFPHGKPERTVSPP